MTERRKKILKTIGALFFLVTAVFYVTYQAKDYLKGPKIYVAEPKEYQTSESSLITIYGKIERVSFVRLNGKEIFLTPDGTFSEQIALKNGYNFVYIWTKDRFGREKETILPVVLKEVRKT